MACEYLYLVYNLDNLATRGTTPTRIFEHIVAKQINDAAENKQLKLILKTLRQNKESAFKKRENARDRMKMKPK